MKNVFIVPAAMLALVGLLFITACPEPDPVVSINTKSLGKAITAALNAKYNVQTAAAATEVPQGIEWVTQVRMNTFNTAINAAQEVFDNPESQAEVDEATADLKTATSTFNGQKDIGTAAAIKLSGTITVKQNGKVVPYAEVTAHNSDWTIEEKTRVQTTAAGFATWEIVLAPLAAETELFFRVMGFSNADYTDTVFNQDIKDLSKKVKDKDVTGIEIDLSNLTLITVSGTFKVDGLPTIRSAVIELSTEGGVQGSHLFPYTNGKTVNWSIQIESRNTEEQLKFSIVGSAHDDLWGDRDYWLFEFWARDFGDIKVSNKNKPGIVINLITISGTITATQNGQPFPGIDIAAHIADEGYLGDTFLGSTQLKTPGANAKWTIVMPALTSSRNVRLVSSGLSTTEGEWWTYPRLFDDFSQPAISVYRTSIANININLGDQSIMALSGTLNVTYEDQLVPFVHITARWSSPSFGSGELGDFYAEYPGPNQPWLIIFPYEETDIEPLLPMTVTFDIWGGSEETWWNQDQGWWERDQLFFTHNDFPVNSLEDIETLSSNIELNLGEMYDDGP